MKKIGIIGGLGPEATADYYRRIVSYFHGRNQSLSTPEIIIYSVDIAELFKFVADKRWDSLVDWLISKLTALKSAGADFAAISANTPPQPDSRSALQNNTQNRPWETLNNSAKRCLYGANP